MVVHYETVGIASTVSNSQIKDNTTGDAIQVCSCNQRNETQFSLGEPSQSTRMSLSDSITTLTSFVCFGISVAAVAYGGFATWLGQTNQLVVIGFLLSILSIVSFKQAQKLLLVFEAAIGTSRLQNYDAILRNEKFGSQTGVGVRVALLVLFALPLVLSALYKQFVNGSTTVPVANTQVVHFGPSGPPGLFVASGRHLFLNATAGLFPNGGDILRQDPTFNKSWGYNMHIINETVTVMLDMPFHSNVSKIQSELRHGRTLTISAHVSATFTRLNSTPTSSERQDFNYWGRITERFGTRSLISRGLGDGGHFDIWNSMVDTTLIFMSLYSDNRNETFYDNAIGFNNYRGTANGTWRITSGSIQLISASNFETNFSPYEQYPEVVGTDESGCVLQNATTNAVQKVLYCGWESLGLDYNSVYPEYVIGLRNASSEWNPSPLSVWVAVTASMMWSVVTAKVESYGIPGPQWQYLISTPEYDMWATIPTLRSTWGLYAVLAVQPVLLLMVLLGRCFSYPSPVSDNFGLITLLAGVDRQSLKILNGASFSGRLRKPVVVHIVERQHLESNPKDATFPAIEYKLCSQSSICQHCNSDSSLSRSRYRPLDNQIE